MKCIKNIWFNSVTILLLLHCAGSTAQTDTICFNDTILYEISDPQSSEYNWNISGGSIIYFSINKDSVIVVWNENTGLHSVEATKINDYSCTSEPERLEVFVYKPAVDLGENRAICKGSNELLVMKTGYEEYFWNDQPGTNEFIVNTKGIIKLEVKDKYGCWAGDSIFVVEKNKPEPEFEVNADFIAVFEGCAPVEITFVNMSNGADTYYWDFGNGNFSTVEAPVTLYSKPGIYEVLLYAKKDTVISISKKSIYVNEAPVADFNITPSETTTLKEIDFINKSSGAAKYLWDFGDGETSELYEPTHSYPSKGVYGVSLSVWSGAGCFDSLLINNAITVKQDCRILFPTGFIPNKSGTGGGYYNRAQKTDNNEVFHPVYENFDAYELKIYSRWGELIFVSRNIDIGWDGYYKGKLAPQDTYIYNAKATCLSGEHISATGSVTLIY